MLKSPVALLAATFCGAHVLLCTLRSSTLCRLATNDFSYAFDNLYLLRRFAALPKGRFDIIFSATLENYKLAKSGSVSRFCVAWQTPLLAGEVGRLAASERLQKMCGAELFFRDFRCFGNFFVSFLRKSFSKIPIMGILGKFMYNIRINEYLCTIATLNCPLKCMNLTICLLYMYSLHLRTIISL